MVRADHGNHHASSQRFPQACANYCGRFGACWKVDDFQDHFLFLKERGLDAVILDLDDWIVDLENRRPSMSVRERYDDDRLERIFDLFLKGGLF